MFVNRSTRLSMVLKGVEEPLVGYLHKENTQYR
jgi:hypothetical protein